MALVSKPEHFQSLFSFVGHSKLCTVRQSGYELFDSKDEIKEYIRQCWAEAKHLFDEGKLLPYADRSLAGVIKDMQSGAVQDDYRVGMIEAYLEDKDEVCSLELWQEGLQNSKPHIFPQQCVYR